jgi:peptidoglycan/xylan/chitin deacetylase (PgdA/CDA1 family)
MMSERARPLVLCYHAVSESWQDALSVSPAVFERQLRAVLQRGYRPAPAAETVRVWGKLLHVTFDDAFRSVSRALPALERLGVPATVFACPALADRAEPFAVPELRAETGEHADELLTMGWDELGGLVERNVEVGSHSLTHPHLTTLGDYELLRELQVSRERLEDHLGVRCRFLAYPYGEEDERVRAAARRSGYEAAFALPGREGPINIFALPRVGIWRKDGSVRVRVKTSQAGRRLLAQPLNSARERWPRLTRGRGPLVEAGSSKPQVTNQSG